MQISQSALYTINQPHLRTLPTYTFTPYVSYCSYTVTMIKWAKVIKLNIYLSVGYMVVALTIR